VFFYHTNIELDTYIRFHWQLAFLVKFRFTVLLLDSPACHVCH